LIPSSDSLSAKTRSKRKRKRPVLRSKIYDDDDDEEDEKPSLARVRETINFKKKRHNSLFRLHHPIL
jgi:hypothetical protein